jgi:hypothetical protein
MRWRVVQGGWAAVLHRGDDVLASLKQLAREADIRSAALSGLGAVEGVQLAYWDSAAKVYERVDFEGDWKSARSSATSPGWMASHSCTPTSWSAAATRSPTPAT